MRRDSRVARILKLGAEPHAVVDERPLPAGRLRTRIVWSIIGFTLGALAASGILSWKHGRELRELREKLEWIQFRRWPGR